jgi:diaminopropionate ammonia-lyase
LRGGCDAAVAVSDDDALRAVADLERFGLSSGPSGAATLAGVRACLTEPARRAGLGLDGDSVVVLLSTEGSTP